MPFRPWNSLAVAAVLFACGGNDGTGPRIVTIADLAGSWIVTDWEYSLTVDPSRKIDWVDLGLTGSLTIAPNGDFPVTPMLPSGFGVDYGTLTVQGDSIYLERRERRGMGAFHPDGEHPNAHLARRRIRGHGPRRAAGRRAPAGCPPRHLARFRLTHRYAPATLITRSGSSLVTRRQDSDLESRAPGFEPGTV